MDNGKLETEEAHRHRLNKNIGSILEPLPLLGSGNEYVKTYEHAMIVALAKEGGAIEEDIAGMLGVSIKTLKKYYREELDNANEYLDHYIRKGMMTSAKRAIDGDARYNPILLRVAACRIGMSDKIQTDLTSSDGSMGARTPIIVVPDCSVMPAVATKVATKPKVAKKPAQPAAKPAKTRAKQKAKAEPKPKPAKPVGKPAVKPLEDLGF